MKKLSMTGLLAICILSAHSQGIQFNDQLRWSEIKETARKQNKYIFIDCYTTWCLPCKQMDRDVFANDSVGRFLNDKFISVKMQMDRTSKDSIKVKQRYADVDIINAKYKITAYPTFLFLSPDGQLRYRSTGLIRPEAFIAIAETAMEPGRTYHDVYEDYDSLVTAFRKGIHRFDRFYDLIVATMRMNDSLLLDSLTSSYYEYLTNLDKNKLYNPSHLSFIRDVIKSSSSPFFSLFYPSGKKVNDVMRNNLYARTTVDKIISKEYIKGLADSGNNGKGEPNWDSVRKLIAKKYPGDFADRAILAAKFHRSEILRYAKVEDIYLQDYLHKFFNLVNKYGRQSLSIYQSVVVNPVEPENVAIDVLTNGFSWDVFQSCEDRVMINKAIEWMKPVVDSSLAVSVYWAHATRDTYACLLYKTGKTKAAMAWEEEAVRYAQKEGDNDSVKDYQAKLRKMRAGTSLLN